MAHLLVVDDDPLFRAALADLLAAHGFVVTQARDGGSALDHMESRPDALVTDLQMPGMDGVDLIDEVRRRAGRETFPAVLVTGAAPDDARVGEALRRPHVTVVHKAQACSRAIVEAVSTALHDQLVLAALERSQRPLALGDLHAAVATDPSIALVPGPFGLLVANALDRLIARGVVVAAATPHGRAYAVATRR